MEALETVYESNSFQSNQMYLYNYNKMSIICFFSESPSHSIENCIPYWNTYVHLIYAAQLYI